MIPVLQWRYASGQTEEKGCKSCRAQDGTANLDQGRSAPIEKTLEGQDTGDCYFQRDEAHHRGSSPAGAQARNQLGSPALTAFRGRHVNQQPAGGKERDRRQNWVNTAGPRPSKYRRGISHPTSSASPTCGHGPMKFGPFSGRDALCCLSRSSINCILATEPTCGAGRIGGAARRAGL